MTVEHDQTGIMELTAAKALEIADTRLMDEVMADQTLRSGLAEVLHNIEREAKRGSYTFDLTCKWFQVPVTTCVLAKIAHQLEIRGFHVTSSIHRSYSDVCYCVRWDPESLIKCSRASLPTTARLPLQLY